MLSWGYERPGSECLHCLVLLPSPGAFYHSKHEHAVFTRNLNLGYVLPITYKYIDENKKRPKRDGFTADDLCQAANKAAPSRISTPARYFCPRHVSAPPESWDDGSGQGRAVFLSQPVSRMKLRLIDR